MRLGIDDEWYWLRELAREFGNQSPTVSDWVTWSITALALGASTFVGFAAWKTSQQATAIAAAALNAEHERDKTRYEDALTQSLATFFNAIARYIAAVQQWRNEVDAAEAPFLNSGSFDPDRINYPHEPSAAEVTATFEATRLIAKGPDGDLLAELEKYLITVRKLPVYKQEILWRKVVASIRKWRTGAWSYDKFVSVLSTWQQKASVSQSQ